MRQVYTVTDSIHKCCMDGRVCLCHVAKSACCGTRTLALAVLWWCQFLLQGAWHWSDAASLLTVSTLIESVACLRLLWVSSDLQFNFQAYY
jgi:hypothetical protein